MSIINKTRLTKSFLSLSVCFCLLPLCVGLSFAQTSESESTSFEEVIEVTIQNAPSTVFNLINTKTYKNTEVRELLDLILTFPRPEVGETQMADQLNSYGTKAFSEKNYSLAAKLFTRAVKANPLSTAFWCNLATASIKAGDFQTAQSAALQALVLHPYHRDTWDLMRQACEGTGNETCRKNADMIFQAMQPAG